MSKKTAVKIYLFIGVVLFGVVLITFHFIKFAKDSKEFWGEPLWVFKPQSVIFDSILTDSSHLILQSSDSIYSLNIDSGNILWQRESVAAFPTYNAPMKINKDTLLMPEQNGIIAVYSEKTGELNWKVSSAFDNSSIEDMNTDSNILYVARYNEYLTAYDLGNGGFLWDKNVPSRTKLYVMPSEDRVYLGAGKSLFTYNGHTGELLREYKLNNLAHYMTVKDGVIYIAYYQEVGFSFSALDINTFKTKWLVSNNTPLDVSRINSIFFENDIFYAVGNRIVAVSKPSGSVLWVSNKKESYKSAVVNGNEIYAVDESYLYIIDKENGIEKKQIPLPGTLAPSLVPWGLDSNYTNLFISGDEIIVISNNQVGRYKLPFIK